MPAGVVKMTDSFKHGKAQLAAGAVYGFEDPEAAIYLKNIGVAQDPAEDDPEPSVVFLEEEFSVDPAVFYADGPNKGRFALEVARLASDGGVASSNEEGVEDNG